MSFLNSLLNSGVHAPDTPVRRRNVQLSNYIGLGLFFLLMTLAVVYTAWYGWYFIGKSLPVVATFSLATVLLNRLGYTTISRLWLSLFMTFLPLCVSVLSKLQYYFDAEELDYFGFRFFMLAGCSLPMILFSFEEKRALISSSIASFLLLMMFDPVHAFFGVPYPEHLLLYESSYFFTNVVVLNAYLIIVGANFFLKTVSERSERRTTILIQELNQMNEELAEKNSEIEAQSSELQAQRDALHENQLELESANRIIEKQKDHLFLENQDLTNEVLEKNKTLTETNHELIKHNNELSQFSHTVSHNLRGPVASLMGLMELLENPEFQNQEGELRGYLKASITKLDGIIRDLGKIIDIRHDIFRIRQKINLATEIESIQQGFQKEIETLNVKFDLDLRTHIVYSVRPMVVSILYNLISNCLKYRALERDLAIRLSCECDDEYFILTVRDNGLGIDLARHGDNIFKMYKRFHHHTDGKGLGLYLIKMQAEALHGRIEVASQPNNFTEFKVYIGIPENVEEQILINETHSKIFYDATLNSTGVIWRGPLTSEQYRSTYIKGLELLKTYHTPSWLTDLTFQGNIEPEDQQWLFREIIPQAVVNGLVRIAAVQPGVMTAEIEDYLKGIEATLDIPGMTLKYFSTFEAARNWLREENEKVLNQKVLA